MSDGIKKLWQIFIHVYVIGFVAFDLYLTFTEQWPFSWFIELQAEYLGAVYAALLIVSFILVLGIQLIPAFLLKWIIDKSTGKSLL